MSAPLGTRELMAIDGYGQNFSTKSCCESEIDCTRERDITRGHGGAAEKASIRLGVPCYPSPTIWAARPVSPPFWLKSE